jgi:hypothetical protein
LLCSRVLGESESGEGRQNESSWGGFRHVRYSMLRALSSSGRGLIGDAVMAANVGPFREPQMNKSMRFTGPIVREARVSAGTPMLAPYDG